MYLGNIVYVAMNIGNTMDYGIVVQIVIVISLYMSITTKGVTKMATTQKRQINNVISKLMVIYDNIETERRQTCWKNVDEELRHHKKLIEDALASLRGTI